MKTLHEARASDPEEREMLAHEAWLASRVAAPGAAAESGFVALRETTAPSAFYAVFDWHPGRTLEQLMAAARGGGQQLEVALALDAALAATRALGRLHRLGIVPRDIHPANLHLATTASGASSTSAWRSRAASRSRCARCTPERRAT